MVDEHEDNMQIRITRGVERWNCAAHANMDKKRVDLSKLAHIETAQKEPTKVETFLSMLNEDDKKEYDKIQLMDIDKKLKSELVSLLKFKSKEEITIIMDWLKTRLQSL
jgi:hypothetical protein